MNPVGHVVIVGAGHAGGRVAQHLRALGFDNRLTLVGDERHSPYERPALSKELLLDLKTPEDLTLAPADFWRDHTAVERVHQRATSLDAARRTLTLADDTQLAFDQLVVATGGMPRALNVPGATLPCVFTLRTIDDSLLLRDALRRSRRAVIIGAGVIGMEVAASAASLGVETTVFEAGERILARCLPPRASQWLHERHNAHGTRIELGVRVEAIERGAHGHGCVVHAKQRDSTSLAVAADLVLVAVGIECSVDFMSGTDLATKNGITVGPHCHCEDAPWLYAVGDVASTFSEFHRQHVRQETWRNAENQSRAVAGFIMGRTDPYVEIPWMWTDQFGHNIQVIGTPSPDDELIVRETRDGHPATTLLLRHGRVVGGVLIDNGRERRHIEALVTRNATIDRARLVDGSIPLKEIAR